MATETTTYNYTLGEKLHEGRSTLVYRANLQSDGSPVIVKIPRNPDPGLREVAKLQQEFDYGKALSEEAAVRPLALQESSDGVALILEDFGGMSLKELIGRGRLAVRSFLKIARILASHLATIHNAGIIHKDIKPANILINADTNTVKFIDFGISSKLSLKSQHLGNPESLEGTLAYISPEQTGRMNRVVDHRSDLYSLGVTFYEILTGRLPFETRDSMELVHSHIARVPPTVESLNSKVPGVLSKIVEKLMAKTAEERYQSAIGLRHDIDECLRLLDNGQIPDFPLGSKDYSGFFQIPQKLYGREDQINTLMKAFARTAGGACEMMLVAGFSGVGKSALVNEVHKPITERRGYFISGKYDQFQRNIPYYAVQQAFEEFTQLVLTESAERLEYWKTRILEAVGEQGQVLIDVVPGLESIIGKQPAVSELGSPQENQTRLNQLFQSFVRAISRADHPLVVFIDDLQWADSASLALIKTLMLDPENSFFLLIGVYRDNEVDSSHPFIQTVEELRQADVVIHDILLPNLAEDDVSQLIAESLLASTDKVTELSQVVYEKTQGNAFFTQELLKDLYENEHLRFNHEKGWEWDAAHIRGLSIQDNVVELMTQKLSRLDPATQEVIKLASCIGNKFDLRILSIIHEKTRRATLDDLWSAVEEGMVQPLDDNYKFIHSGEADGEDGESNRRTVFKFAHDRVQQASYGLMDKEQLKEVHLRIGRLLLSHSDESEVEDRIFDIVNQFNEGRDLVTDAEERLKLAGFNWRAAGKAMKSSAFQSAVSYLTVAESLLDKDKAWDKNHDLIWSIYADRASASFSSAMYEESEKDILYALPRSKTEDQRVRLYQIYMLVLFNVNRHEEGVQVSREALKTLGIKLPRRIGKVHVGIQYILFRLRLGFRKARDLFNLPDITNQRQLNIIKVLYDAVPSTYMVRSDQMGYICVYMARICLRYGNSSYAPFAYAMVALVQEGVTKEYNTAFDFINMALALNEKYPELDVEGRVHFTQNGFTLHWKRPIEEHKKHMVIARQIFHDTGNVHWRNYAAAFTRTQSIQYYKSSLAEIDEENVKFYDSMLKSRDREICLNQYFLVRHIRKLRGVSMEGVENVYEFDEEPYDAEMRTPGNFVPRVYFFAFKMVEGYLFENWDQAYKYARDSFRTVLEVLGILLDQPVRFFYCMTILELKRQRKLSLWGRFKAKIPYALNKFLLKHAAKNCPENFETQYRIVLAEEARMKKKWDKAEVLYEKAIEEADKAGFPLFRALSNELAGKLFLDQKKTRFASLYLREAHRLYSRWGAMAKVKDLEARYPEAVRGGAIASARAFGDTISATTTATMATTSTGGGGGLDMATVVKATQAISGEIKLESLLSRLMKNVIENAGAERACLFLAKEGQLFLEAEDSTQPGEPSIMKSVPIQDSNVAISVVQYVFRSSQEVVLANAAAEGKFTRDEYVSANQVRSLLCLPISNQGRVVGLLYLENNLATDAFTPDRLEVLGILASQAAISLENSRLVAEETERQKLQKEMEMAKHVQMSILPQITEDDAYNIAAHMTPAEQVGGDYYDYYLRGSTRWIAIGDVTGHGLNSGLLMLMAQTGFSTYLNSTPNPDTMELFSAVNRTLHENMATRTKQNLYMTFTALRADDQGNFEHVGKHEDILVWRKSTGKVEVVGTEGVWMGIVPQVDGMLQKSNFKLEPGDFVCLYTDGVIECRDRSREQFDTPRLIAAMEEHAAAGLEAVRDGIVKACFDFMDKQDDDVTLFLMQKK